MHEAARREVALYIKHAHQSLKVSQLNLDNDFYAAAINRAYYAIFYAANALLATHGLSRRKHSGVLAEFRLHFVKTGLISPELSEIYGQVMDDRHESDYELIIATTAEDAKTDLLGAEKFVDQVETWLKVEGWL